MVDLRKLAAIDIAFLGYGLIVGEFAFGVVFSLALGAFVLVRGHLVANLAGELPGMRGTQLRADVVVGDPDRQS
jgi:hypothetical protein